jgi:hypothetical protein
MYQVLHRASETQFRLVGAAIADDQGRKRRKRPYLNQPGYGLFNCGKAKDGAGGHIVLQNAGNFHCCRLGQECV